MQLRPYQQDLIVKIKRILCSGSRSAVVVLGCGGGKSIIQGMIAKSATDKDNRVLFLVHRKELVNQITETFKNLCGVNMNLCDIMMVQTASRRLNKLPEYQLIITDECHHSLSESYLRIYEKYDVIRLGFTATPCRMNEGGLGKVYESIVEGVSTRWLIDNQYLSPYKYYSVKLADTDGLHTRSGDYMREEIAELMEQNAIYGGAVKTWQDKAAGKKTIIYCASIKASKETVEKFQKSGIKAAHLDGSTPGKEREQTVEQFRSGEITVLSNVDLFGEGFDVPDCECVVLLRPTKSLTLHIQQSMRSMRYKQDKTAIIIDHVGNVYRHGLPDDKREWTLESKKRGEKSTVTVRQCPECLAVFKSKLDECPVCGIKFPAQERAERKTIEAELEEITRENISALKERPYQEYRDLKTFEEMDMFRKAKGYKFMWTIHKCLELNISIPPKYKGLVKRFA